jgi:cardiolipin synthase
VSRFRTSSTNYRKAHTSPGILCYVGALKHLPNLLSTLRLVLAPYVFYLIVRREYGWVLDWFAFAAATDALDGWVARRLGVESPVGRALDPIADKVLLSGAFVALAVVRVIPLWLAAVVLGRDALILLGAGLTLFFGQKKREFPPSLWGKVSTIAQSAFVLIVIISAAGASLSRTVSWMGFAIAALAVWSGLDYARRATGRLARQ